MRVKIDPGAFAPERAHDTDAGYDLRIPRIIVNGEFYTLCPGSSVIIDTGVHIEIPKGYCGILVSKSGLNTKHGIVSTGLIDEGYTGSIRVRLHNSGKEICDFYAGDKISQIVIVPYLAEPVEIVDELEPTERGNNGFGSTGR